MKRINKSLPPNVLTQFYDLNPDRFWSDFRESNSGNDYKEIKDLIFSDQGELCAYCEKSLSGTYVHKRRIEHYHSKSDTSNPCKNWDLDWNNLIGVCVGGSDEKVNHPLPENLSCDSHKAHLENNNGLSKQCEGYVLNPLQIIATPCLFKFEKATGKLKANPDACSYYIPEYNNYETVEELVTKTIDIFNLNCDRLNTERLQVFFDYQRKIKSARQNNNINIHSQLAKLWFSKKWPSFFSMRRILLGCEAEKFLASFGYEG